MRSQLAPKERRRVHALFCELVDLGEGARERKLGRAGADVALDVRQLLSAADRSTRVLGEIDRLFAREVDPGLEPGPDPLLGRDVSHYRILERLGAGGMGVVYRARDTRLGRVVALKLLHPSSALDDVARARLVREARAASALDHPNLATIYDILEMPGGRDCIAMAHYEGRTVKELLRDGPLELATVCEIGIQVAHGLEAAHGNGIVHCDVKPGNVLVMEEGVVKILDFGLARFVERRGSDDPSTHGTLPYMAPEQIRGSGVTPATDVWALGVTLHEMATGHRPFGAGEPANVARAIVQRIPRGPSSWDPDLPSWFDDLVARALEKDAEGRPAAGGVRLALEEGRESLELSGTASVLRGRSGRALSIGAAALIVAGGIVASTMWGGPSAPRFGNPRQLSAAEGVEDFAAWSPVAHAVVYQAEPGGEIFGGSPDVLLRELDAEVPRNLTADHAGFDGRPSWSPDGSRIVFYSEREGGGYFVGSPEKGPVRRVWKGRSYCCGHNAAAWSPDGSELAITVDGGPDGATLEVISAADGALRRTVPLPGRPGNMRFGTTWSPDGRFVAVTDAMNLTPDEARLWIVRMEDGEAIPVTGGRTLAWSPTWGPESRMLYYVSDRGGSRDLWAQAVAADGRPRGDPQEVTTGIGMRNASLSGDGTRLVYSKGRMVARVWRIPIPDTGTSGWDEAEPVTSDRAYVEFVEADPTGGSVFVSSDRSGSQDLWRIDRAREGGMTRLTTDPAPAWAPMLSPDGTHVAYYSARTGNRDVWVRSLVDGTEIRVTRHEAIDFVPSWSPDGRRLVFSSGRSGNLDIWIVAADGKGSPRRVTTDPATDGWPHWSPDGSRIVFRSNRGGRTRLWSVPAEGGSPRPITDRAASYFRWAPGGTALYMVSDGQIWRHDLETGKERPLTALDRRRGSLGVVALAQDERSLYFAWEEDTGDLWMMERLE